MQEQDGSPSIGSGPIFVALPFMANNPLPGKNPDKKRFQKELRKPPVRADYKASGKLDGKVAVVTGGDSGIGRSIAMYYALEGARVLIVYNESVKDADKTCSLITEAGGKCFALQADLRIEYECVAVVEEALRQFGRLDIVVNNAGNHEEAFSIEDISKVQLEQTFETNIFSFFYIVKAALPHLKKGAAIINTASVVAYRGSAHLLDYSSSKGAIVSFTRSLAVNLAPKGIRVNGVAPGPVWTPLVYSSFEAEHLEEFGKDTPLGRAGYPYEFGPAYVYLASEDSSYVTGQFIHINGGDAVVS
jgi:NAD(P)-dependent dehydrogenase (short-subunit alcohol dehydrogenase family)